MKRTRQILLCALCAVVLLTSWIVAINTKTSAERQIELMYKAGRYMQDGVYVLAVPLLEEAVTLSTRSTWAVEAELKRAYLALINTRGYRSKYIGLLENQLKRNDAPADVFLEAANFYLSARRTCEAFAILIDGISRTGCENLIQLYESHRYAYEINRVGYDYARAIYGGYAQVQKNGLWGLARLNGSLVIPIQYEQISTFYSDRAIVKRDNKIYAVDINNNRVSLFHGSATDIGLGFAENRIALRKNGVWHRATGDFVVGSASFEELGMYSEGYVAAKLNGRWGVISRDMAWLIPTEFDGIIKDELGRSYGQGAVFVKRDSLVHLFIDGKPSDEFYEDAKPFSNEGYAAVKRHGKWGFIDRNGELKIDFTFDDALSFGQHLAAVKIDGYWGYIDIRGNVVIEPTFLDAKSFVGGSAPVLTERGWDFITLIEFR